jgi:PAS domain S-box-containing protein
MTSRSSPSPLPRARRLILNAAGFVWLVIAAWGVSLYARTSRHHANATQSLEWLLEAGATHSRLSEYVAGLSNAADPGSQAAVAPPPPELRSRLAPDSALFRSGVRDSAVEALERKLRSECDLFLRDADAANAAAPAERPEALHHLERSALRLLAALGELAQSVRDDLVESESSLNVGGLVFSLFAFLSLFAVALLVMLLRDARRRGRALDDSRAALSESEQRFREIADGAPVVLVISDPVGNTTFTNQAWRDFSGSSDDSAERWKSLIHPDDLPRVSGERDRARATGEPYEFEFRIRRKDGAWRWWLDRAVPRRDKQGRLLGYAALCLDITDRKAFEERNLESQRMEAMGRLAGGIAHDLNNILTVVIGSTDLLLADPADAPAVRENADEIRSAAERAAQLVSQLLAFTRRQVVMPAALDVGEVVRAMAGLLRRLIGEDVALGIEAPADPRRVVIDPAQLTQIVLNLVINAREAMPGGGRIDVAVAGRTLDAAQARERRLGEPGEFVEIAVRDDGGGMDATTRERIFEPFFTTKASGRHAGLGLATVKTIVDELHGAVEVESAIGKGTTVRVVMRAVVGGRAAAGGLPPGMAPAPEGESATILLVEDDEAVRPLLRRYLERGGHRVVDAGRVGDAIDAARRERTIDLLVTDVVMPEAGGRKLAAAIAEIHPAVQVLYMSGYTDDEVLRRGISLEGQSFLQKPFSRAELTRRVAELLAAGRKGRPASTAGR